MPSPGRLTDSLASRTHSGHAQVEAAKTTDERLTAATCWLRSTSRVLGDVDQAAADRIITKATEAVLDAVDETGLAIQAHIDQLRQERDAR